MQRHRGQFGVFLYSLVHLEGTSEIYINTSDLSRVHTSSSFSVWDLSRHMLLAKSPFSSSSCFALKRHVEVPSACADAGCRCLWHYCWLVCLTGWSTGQSACSCPSPSYWRPLDVVVTPPADFVPLASPGPSAAPPARGPWDHRMNAQRSWVRIDAFVAGGTAADARYLCTSCVFSCFSLDLRSPFSRISFSSSATFFSREDTW